ncbi:MAG: flavodoxin family protein [Candidatus Thorarchaeota archaeon]
MLIAGICGSPKTEKSHTEFLLSKALEAASSELSNGSKKESTTVLLNISDYEIRPCTGCDACVRRKPCPESEHDDIPKIEEWLKKADGIIISAPSYFTAVPGVLKNLIDRSRPMKMNGNELKNKVFGAISYAGLRYGGQEHIIDYLNRFALGHGMIVVGAVGNPVKDGFFGAGSLQTDNGKWRSARDDELAIRGSIQLGRRIAELVNKMQ